jgi:hypothetical protein
MNPETQIEPLKQVVEALPEHAPAEPIWSAKRTLTGRQKVVFSLFALGSIAIVVLAPLLAAQLTLVAVTALFLSAIALRSTYAIVGLRSTPNRPIPLSDAELPTYTVVVALYREARVVPQLCGALAAGARGLRSTCPEPRSLIDQQSTGQLDLSRPLPKTHSRFCPTGERHSRSALQRS